MDLIAGKLPSPPPQNPTQVSVSPSSVQFEWVSPTDIGGASKLDSFKIYKDKTVLIDTVDASQLSYTYSTTSGEVYHISISSVSEIGEGAQSNPLTIWAINLPSAPTLSLTDTSRDTCSISWTAVVPPSNSLITGYIVLIDDGLDGDFVIGYNGAGNPSAREATIEGLSSRTTYRLKVYATNKAGLGAVSDEITCFTVTIPNQPGRPQLVTSTSSSIKVEWEPAFDDGGSPIAEYQLEMDEVEGIGEANIETWVNVFSGAALTYTVTSGLTSTL